MGQTAELEWPHHMPEVEKNAADTLHTIVHLLEQLDKTARTRVLQAVTSYFKAEILDGSPSGSTSYPGNTQPLTNLDASSVASRPNYSSNLAPSPKEFLAQKQPRTDVERVACLAYYLTHFRETPFFKTLDLAKLNTEAANPKFSNASYAANNAANTGYLAPAANGQRQISAAGELFVQTLPDRDAARAVMTQARRRKAARRKK